MKKLLFIALFMVVASDAFATISGAVCTKNGRTIQTSDDIHGFMKENKANGWDCRYIRD